MLRNSRARGDAFNTDAAASAATTAPPAAVKQTFRIAGRSRRHGFERHDDPRNRRRHRMLRNDRRTHGAALLSGACARLGIFDVGLGTRGYAKRRPIPQAFRGLFG